MGPACHDQSAGRAVQKLETDIGYETRDGFLAALYKDMPQGNSDYIATIKGLPEVTRKSGTAWLNGIVKDITEGAIDMIPSFK